MQRRTGLCRAGVGALVLAASAFAAAHTPAGAAEPVRLAMWLEHESWSHPAAKQLDGRLDNDRRMPFFRTVMLCGTFGPAGLEKATLNGGALTVALGQTTALEMPVGPIIIDAGVQRFGWTAEVSRAEVQLSDGTLRGTFDVTIKGVPRDFAFNGTWKYHLDARSSGGALRGTFKAQDAQSGAPFASGSLSGLAGPVPASAPPPAFGAVSPVAADPQRAREAAAEALAPLHPGKIGVSGQPGVAGPTRLWADHGGGRFIHPPTFFFGADSGASRYRVTVSLDKVGQPLAAFDATGPQVCLAEAWAKIPPASSDRGAAYVLTAVRADGADKPAAGAEPTRRFDKRAPFGGTSYGPVLDADRRLLAHLRGLRDTPLFNVFKTDVTAERLRNDGGPKNGPPPSSNAYAVIGAMSLLARLAPDAAEKEAALAIAGRAAAWTLKTFGGSYDLPGTWYKTESWTPCWAGHAFLELHAATGDPKWAVAAKRIGAGLAKIQQPSGAWTWSGWSGWLGNGPWGSGGYQRMKAAPEWTEIGAADFLYYYGRLRAELKTQDFAAVERKALHWVLAHDVETGIWAHRYSNHGAPDRPPHICAPFPLQFALYLLDCDPPDVAAPDRIALAQRAALLLEDQTVEWDAVPDGRTPAPAVRNFIGTWAKTHEEAYCANHTAALALVFAKLYRATGKPLYAAKAQALVGGLYAYQDPKCGQIPHNYDRENYLQTHHRREIFRTETALYLDAYRRLPAVPGR